jgi:hypothetical protein
MQTRNQIFGTTACRPVTTERDYVGAVTCLIRMSFKKPLDPVTEARRIKLVKAVHEFDSDPFMELDAVGAEQAGRYGGVMRRWSDANEGWS